MESFVIEALAKGGLTAAVVLLVALGAWRAVGKAWQVFAGFLSDIVSGQRDMTKQFVESMSSISEEMKAQRESSIEQHHEVIDAVAKVSERVARIEARGDERDSWEGERTPVGVPSRRYGKGKGP